MGEVCQNAGFQLLLGSVSLTEWISPSKMDSGAEIGQDIQPERGILGLIDEDVKSSFLLPWFAHCVHLDDEEITRMGDAGAGISYCPTSNMRLGSGIARIREMLNAGVRVSLGVDGSASNDSGNMLMEIRNAMLLSRLREETCWLSARDVLLMATRGGAAVLGRSDIGEISPGKQADLALFSMNGIEYAGGMSDPLAALVFCLRQAPVDHLIINGRIRITNGRSKTDMHTLIDTHNRLAEEMLKRAGEFHL